MVLAYILEVQGKDDLRSNQPTFQLINQLKLEEDSLIFDDDTKRENLKVLLDKIKNGDKLIVRSVKDFADSLSDLVDILKRLSEKQVTLCSCKEPFLCGDDYLEYLNGYVELYLYFYKKNKEMGYKKAVAEGRVGRPAKTKEIELALSMYETGNFKMAQIEAITGISKSTIYRYLK